MKKTITVDIICCLLILLFLYTGIWKTMTFSDFKDAIHKSFLIRPIAPLMAVLVIVTELTLAGMLLASFFSDRRAWRKWGLLGSAILMGLFTTYVYVMIHFFPSEAPCTCGGIIQKMSWHQHLYFNTIYTLMAIFGCWLNARHKEPAQFYSVNYQQGQL